MRGRSWLLLSALFLLLYTGYVLVAKFGKHAGIKLPFELGNVGEFWLFTAFIGAFCMQIIRDERALPPINSPSHDSGADNSTTPIPQLPAELDIKQSGSKS
jgi:hypothetical protein